MQFDEVAVRVKISGAGKLSLDCIEAKRLQCRQLCDSTAQKLRGNVGTEAGCGRHIGGLSLIESSASINFLAFSRDLQILINCLETVKITDFGTKYILALRISETTKCDPVLLGSEQTKFWLLLPKIQKNCYFLIYMRFPAIHVNANLLSHFRTNERQADKG